MFTFVLVSPSSSSCYWICLLFGCRSSGSTASAPENPVGVNIKDPTAVFRFRSSRPNV